MRFRFGLAAICTLFLMGVANVAQGDSIADRQLEHAVSANDLQSARDAINNGANVNQRAYDGGTPLMDACEDTAQEDSRCDVEMALLLIQHGADVNAATKNGDTALMCLAEDSYSSGDSTVAEVLIKHGARVNASDSNGQTALISAAIADNVDMVHLLIANGARLDDKDVHGKTALMWACWQGPGDEDRGKPGVAIARFLVEHEANVNQQSSDKRTPLMWLARVDVMHENDALELARLLVRRGARVDMRNDHGKTAIQIAYANGLHRLARYLRSAESGNKG